MDICSSPSNYKSANVIKIQSKMIISCKPDILCHNPRCPYDQWLLHASKKKQLNKTKYKTIQGTRIVKMGSVLNSKSTLDNYKMHKWLKQGQQKSKNIKRSFPEHIRIPADPRAPHAFTLNVVTCAKSKKKRLKQVSTLRKANKIVTFLS